jgi:hypothetical protein
MAVKRESTKVESDNSPKPKRPKIKTEATTSPAKQRTSYTVEDAQLMKKLREEQNLPWE